MRSSKSFVALLAVFTLGLGATSMPASAAIAIAPSTVTIAQEGGFVAPQYQLANLPQLVGYSNGVVLKRNDASKLANASQALYTQVSVGRMNQYLDAIVKAAKTPPHGWGFPGVADVPNTIIRIDAPGLHLNRSVYALAFTNGGNLSKAQRQARVALWTALSKFTNWVNRHKATAYNPASFELWTLAQKLDNGGVGIANPASVFCQSMFGTTEIEHTAAGDAGICVLQDGTRIDEWKYFRTESAKLAKWPSGVAVPSGRPATQGALGGGCVVVAAKKVAKLISANRVPGPWLLPSGQAMPVSLRPVLPGENACHR
jgi:putative hemolysin